MLRLKKWNTTLLILLIIAGCNPAGEQQTASEKFDDISFFIETASAIKNYEADSALFLAQKALHLSQEVKYELGIAGSSLIIGEICYEKGEYNKANTYLIQAMKIFESKNDLRSLGETYNLIGRVYQYSGQFELARMNYGKGLESFKGIADKNGIAETYGNIGHLNEKTQNYDSAIYFNSKAKKLYEQLKDSIGLARIYDNFGSIYEDLEDFQMARVNFEEAYDLNKRLGNDVEAIINLNNIADTHRKTGNYTVAIKTTLDALREAKKLNQPYQVKSAYRDVARAYYPMGKFEEAYLYLDSCYEISDQLYTQEISRGIADTRTVYELEQKQQQIEILEKSKRLDQFTRTALIIATLLIIIIGALISLQQRTRIRKNQQLYTAERSLAKAKQEQLEAELNIKKLQEEKLQQELENRSRELTANALHIIQKNEFLSTLKTELKQMKYSEDEQVNKKIKKITKSIDYNFSLDDDWQEFESIFQQVHAEFFEELRKQYPDLTSAEIRLCAMLRLNLNSKDIATIMGISQDSLRIARYRLRKKLGIDKGGNLYSFIMNIG